VSLPFFLAMASSTALSCARSSSRRDAVTPRAGAAFLAGGDAAARRSSACPSSLSPESSSGAGRRAGAGRAGAGRPAAFLAGGAAPAGASAGRLRVVPCE